MRRRGFTVAEVMVGVVFLSIALLALLGTQIHAVRSTEGNRQRLEASELAATVMSGIESRLREDPAQSVTAPKTLVRGDDGPWYEVSEQWEDEATRKLRRVDVIVHYRDDNVEHDYRLWTLFYDDSI